jgi:hypothetical protein
MEKKFVVMWTMVFVIAMSVFSAHAQDLDEFQNRFTFDYLDHDGVRSVFINCNDTLQHTIEIKNSEVCPGRCEVSIYEHDEEEKLIGRYHVEEQEYEEVMYDIIEKLYVKEELLNSVKDAKISSEQYEELLYSCRMTIWF